MKKLVTFILTLVASLTLCSNVFAAETVTIAFDANGGTVATNVLNTESGKSLSDENTPTRSGYDFMGWTYDPNADYIIRLTEIKPTSDVTLYAKWSQNKNDSFVVTLDANGGSYSYSSRAYVYNRNGTTMDDPTEPTRDGYTFGGWAASSTSTQVVDVTTTTSETTYYAIWNQVSTETCTVTFDSAGGTELSSQTVTKGSSVERPTDPIYSGKIFKGWFLEGEPFDFSLPIKSDITLVAHWENVSNSNFVITFIAGDENGGSTFADGAYMHSIKLSDALQVLNQEDPKPTRYTSFAFWSQVKTPNWGTAGANIFDTGQNISSNITLYACYKEADNSATIAEVRFDANGGHWTTEDGTDYDVKKLNVDKNTKVVKPDNPKWGNRKFSGWYSTDDDDPDEDAKWDFNDTVVEDITLYAHWTEKESEEETPNEITSTPQDQIPQNFPNPENLPVVEPLADSGVDAGAESIKDIPTTGINLDLGIPCVLILLLLATLSTIVLKRRKGNEKIH